MYVKRYEGVQVLRGVAAMLVLFVHAILVTPAPRGLFFHPLAFGGGAIGVDLFFVISGFVVAMAASRPGLAAREFMKNRALRVLPIYFAFSIPFLFIDALSLSKIWNTLLFVPVFDVDWYTDPLHWLGWTIGLEMWFYGLLAFGLLTLPRAPLRVFAVLVLALVGGGLVYEGRWVAIQYVTSPIALEFLLGVAIFCVKDRIGFLLAIALLCAGLVAMWHGLTFSPFLVERSLVSKTQLFANTTVGVTRLLMWGLPCALIVAAVVGIDRANIFRWPAALISFGDISYSFYLAQPLAILLMRNLFIGNWMVAWAALFALNLGMAWLAHRYVDLPLRQWLSRPIRRKPPIPATTY